MYNSVTDHADKMKSECPSTTQHKFCFLFSIQVLRMCSKNKNTLTGVRLQFRKYTVNLPVLFRLIGCFSWPGTRDDVVCLCLRSKFHQVQWYCWKLTGTTPLLENHLVVIRDVSEIIQKEFQLFYRINLILVILNILNNLYL